ncbi:MAG: hypothetical protein IPM54_11325 [Polyangiaceae bacterium]|nr:hypothetical protein [Polyangiaceae bacterium]
MTTRRSAMLGGLMMGFVGAWMAGACGGGGPAPGECTAVDDPPVEEPSTACAKPPATGCKRFFLPLLGNPSMNPELAAKYRAAFGLAACYVPADANAPFNCWYKEEDLKEKDGKDGKACRDAKRIGEVSGLAKYDQGYKCQKNEVTGDWWVQVGSDVANKIDIKLGDAPLETSLIDVDGVPTEINGPYRNLPQLTTIKPGEDFYCSTGLPGPDGGTLNQREWILQVNRAANDGGIRSDLAGFMYPCEDKCGKPMICTEPEFLKAGPANDPEAAQVHHVQRRKDLRRCEWGTNANSNAVVISRKLNIKLRNYYPSANEVNWVNKVPPYTYTP